MFFFSVIRAFNVKASVLFSVFPILLQVLNPAGASGFCSDNRNQYSNDSLRQKFQEWTRLYPTEKACILSDKPLYSPGETIWFSVFLSPSNPATRNLSEIVFVELLSPNGSVEKKFNLIARNGIGNGDFILGADARGGLYRLKAYTRWMEQQGNFSQREIQVQDFFLPAFRLSLELSRKAYRPGDEIEADLQADGPENKPLEGAALSYSITAAGQTLWSGTAQANSSGHHTLRCRLPEIPGGAKPVLNCEVNHKGVREFISRSIPLVEGEPLVQFFPEGGDFVLGREAGIAFRVLKQDSTTADAAGWLTDNSGKQLTPVKTRHDGMGYFRFIPQAGKTYRINWESPLRFSSALPDALEKGYSLALEIRKEEVQLKVAGIVNEKLQLLVRQRDQLVWSQSISAGSNFTGFSVPTVTWQPGVAVFSLFDSRGMLRCERMAFINPDKRLSIKIKTDKAEYGIREKVQVNVLVSDPSGIPVPARMVLSVCNDALLRYADDRQGNLLSGLLLEQELQSRPDRPDYYFSGKPGASEALDLLMLTYGWRGISWEKMQKEAPEMPASGPEKAVIEGIILNEMDQTPLRGALLEIGKIKVRSDSNGHFRFPFVDLHKPAIVKISWRNFPPAERTITAYSSQTLLYYSPYPVMYDKAVPLRAMGEINEFQLVAPKAIVKPEPAKARRLPGGINRAEEEGRAVGKAARIFPRPGILPQENAVQESPYYMSRKYPELPLSRSAERSDFRSTLFWSGAVELDRNGRGSFSFRTADELSTWRIAAQALGPENLPGYQEEFFSTVLPFSLSSKLPLELITGDVAEIPVVVKNRAQVKKDFTLTAASGPQLSIQKGLPAGISLGPGESRELVLSLRADRKCDSCKIRLEMKSGADQDVWEKSLKILPSGYPQNLSFSGSEMNALHLAVLNDPVAGSVDARVKVFPDVTSDLLTGVESILAEPFGCFEQTSMSSYPNAMVLSYLRENPGKNPELVKRSEELLEKGYKMLTAFETKQKGYEWFGGAPAHEALTAYGLMQFKDMQKVAPAIIDEEMLKRTSDWLLSRRDGKGGFLRSPQALDNFGRAAEDITNAYIIYGLAEAGFQQLDNEIKTASAQALERKDPYVLALLANSLWLLDKKEEAREMTRALVSTRKEDGSWTGKRHSITYSTGQALMVETTGFAILALIRSREADRGMVDKAVGTLVAQRQGKGGFGNSQATIVALKALTAFVVYSKRTLEDGAFRLAVNGDSVASAAWKSGTQKTIEASGWEKHLKNGKNELSFQYSLLTKPLPYTISIDYYSKLPLSHPQAALELSRKLSSERTTLGKPVQMDVELKNTTQEGRPMTMACISVPAGCALSPTELKELMDSRQVDFYETRGNTVFFYFRQMAPGEVKKIRLNLLPVLKGSYALAASSAYLYYTAEKKFWSPGLQLVIE